MAMFSSNSSSTTSPTSSSIISQEKYDVFLSFRGEDTRYSFTSHLYSGLSRLKIKTYIDRELERGEEISPALIKAIEGARVSVVVFSKNYAHSKWCLDELEKIIERKRNNGQIIVPVFHQVDPSQVRNQTGSFADAFAKHEQRYENDMTKVQRWRVALAEAANLSGWDCFVNRIESELVEEIAQDVLQKLDSLGGLESRIANYKLKAKQKLENSLRTGKQKDVDDLIVTLEELADLKLEKAFRTDKTEDWEDISVTNERLLELKKQKSWRTGNQKDEDDYKETLERVNQIEMEKQNRITGRFRGF